MIFLQVPYQNLVGLGKKSELIRPGSFNHFMQYAVSKNSKFKVQCYYTDKKTLAMRNTNAGYWATVYHVIHAKYAAERTHDACKFTNTSRPGNKHLCFTLLKYFVTESSWSR